MKTLVLERDFDPKGGGVWNLLEDAARNVKTPKENIWGVLRLSITGDKEDRVCPVPVSHADKDSLGNQAVIRLRWYSEKHFWITKAVKILDNVPLKEPDDERLSSCFPWEGRKADFALAFAVVGGFETIWAVWGFLEDGDTLDDVRGFFDKFYRDVNGSVDAEPLEVVALRAALQQDQIQIVALKEELKEARAQLEKWMNMRPSRKLYKEFPLIADIVEAVEGGQTSEWILGRIKKMGTPDEDDHPDRILGMFKQHLGKCVPPDTRQKAIQRVKKHGKNPAKTKTYIIDSVSIRLSIYKKRTACYEWCIKFRN